MLLLEKLYAQMTAGSVATAKAAACRLTGNKWWQRALASARSADTNMFMSATLTHNLKFCCMQRLWHGKHELLPRERLQ